MYDPSQPGANTFFTKVSETEVGHGLGLEDVACDFSANNCGWKANSVMDGFCQTNDEGGCGQQRSRSAITMLLTPFITRLRHADPAFRRR